MPQWLLWLIAFVPAVILHEVAHGWVADHYGDHTARNAGRLTLNPLKHIDIFGSVILPAMMLLAGLPPVGYAKPVPVNVNRLRKPRNQSVIVSLAGPAVNIGFVVLAWVACRIWLSSNPGTLEVVSNQVFYSSDWALFFLFIGVVNMLLAILNLIPLPPLDGSAVVERLVPRRHLGSYFQLRARMLPVALILFLVLALSGATGHVMNDFQVWWVRSL